jgi:predicted Zn-dependent peptidase
LSGTPGREIVSMPDRHNLDVRLGHGLDIRRDHPDYVALYVGVHALGGNFSARLMNCVRDELGLTYGITARLVGASVLHAGHFQVSVTLSGDNLEPGIEAARAVIDAFVGEGVSAPELARHQETLAGGYSVGLGTTRGMAEALLTAHERGFGSGYLDRFPELIRALSVDEVNAAVRRYLRPERLHVVVAGTPPAVGEGTPG